MQGRVYNNALQAALYRGYKHVVKILLRKGADVNRQSRYYSNALHVSLGRGYKQLI
jgi:ankyrin repeat protein